MVCRDDVQVGAGPQHTASLTRFAAEELHLSAHCGLPQPPQLHPEGRRRTGAGTRVLARPVLLLLLLLLLPAEFSGQKPQ